MFSVESPTVYTWSQTWRCCKRCSGYGVTAELLQKLFVAVQWLLWLWFNMINEIILITWRKFSQQLDERSDSKKLQLVALLPLGTATWSEALLPPLTVTFKLTLMCVCMHILENYFGAFCHWHVFVSSTMHTNSPFCLSSVVMLQSSTPDEGPLLPPMFDINPYMPRDFFNAAWCKKPSCCCKRWLPPKNNRGKHLTSSALNKGSSSSEVHVSRMPKLHTAKQINKTSYGSWIWDGGFKWVKTIFFHKTMTPSCLIPVQMNLWPETTQLLRPLVWDYFRVVIKECFYIYI